MKNLMMFAALIAAGCAAQTTAQQSPDDTDAGVDPADSADPAPGEPCEPGAFLGCTGNIAKRCSASCTGTVRMAGTIEAGGGGGQAGGDGLITTGIALLGGAGGGAGEYAVLQGATVTVSGLLFAGGGGGGGGCSDNGCKGANGEDSIRARARGGAGVASTGAGGAGGFGATAPNAGVAGGSPGGGGGSVDRFQIFTPEGVTPAITGTAQPAFEPNRTLVVR